MADDYILEVHPRRHSPLGGSSIDRVLECPASLALGRKAAPKAVTFPMLEGTAAHRLAEHLLDPKAPAKMPTHVRIFDDPGPILGQAAPPTAKEFLVQVTREMIDAVRVYVDEIKMAVEAFGRENVEIHVEEEVQCPGIHAEAFGSLDCYIWIPKMKAVRIYDYKHGRGKKSNAKLQMGYYCIGLLRKHPEAQTFICTTVQPRYHGDDDNEFRGRTVDEWSREELLSLESIMAARAKLAMDILKSGAQGEFSLGEHCEYCPALGICPKQEQQAEETAMVAFDEAPAEPELLPIESIPVDVQAKVVLMADKLRAWIKAVEANMLSMQLDGRGSATLKIVRGKPGNREWKDPVLAEQNLACLLGEDEIIEKKLISPAAAEKLLGGKAKAKVLEPLVTRKEGKLVLASVTDKRAVVAPNATQDVFADDPEE